MYTRLLTSNPCTLGCVHKSKYFWSSPHRSPNILTLGIHMRWDHLDLTLHYPFGVLYKEPLDTLKGRNWRARKLYSIVVVACLYLIMHPFVPWITWCSSQAYIFLWGCYREMEDWGGGGPSGGLNFFGLQTCRHRLSLMYSRIYINRNIFSCLMMCI